MARGTGTAGRIVKKRPRKAAKPRRPSKTVRRSSPSTASTDDLREQLNEALAHQAATAEVLRVISSSPGELGPVFKAILEKAINICDAKFGSLYRSEGDSLRIVAMHGAPQPFAEERRRNPIVRPGPQSTFGRALAKKQPVQVADVLNELQTSDVPTGTTGAQIAKLAGARTVLVVPMLKVRDLMGAITIYRQEVRPFTDKQMELVSNFASQAVIAIENARLLNELREALDQQTATSKVLSVISSSPGELEPVFQAMLENAVDICGAKFGVMFRFDGDASYPVASLNLPPALADFLRQRGRRPPNPGTVLDQMWKSKQVLHTVDALAEDNPSPPAKLAGARTHLSVPMLKDNQLVGAITIYRTEVRPFTDKQIELVKNFAAQAVIAIENTRLLNELRERTNDLSESLQQQTASAKVLGIISVSPGELQPVFDAILENSTRLCEAEFGILTLSDGDKFTVSAMYNAPPKFAELRRRKPTFAASPLSAAGRIAVTKQVLHIADYTEETTYKQRDSEAVALAELAGARSLVVVPMLNDDTLIGAIFIYRQKVQPFTDKQIDLVKSYAAQAVIAIENARLLNELRQRTDDLTESLEQQTATSEVLKTISRSPGELEPVFKSMLENAVRICQAQFGTVFRYDGEGFHFSANIGTPKELVEFQKKLGSFRPSDGILARLLRQKTVILVDDDQLSPVPGPPAKYGGARSVVAVPMLKDDDLVGACVIYRQEVRPFTDKQVELLTNFAAQAAIAIENVRLFESVEARTKELAASLEDLRSTQDRLVQTEKLASLGQLTAGIAHEIKNPLNFVNNFSTVSVELIDELRQALAAANLDDKLRAEIGEIADMLQGNLDKVVQHGRRADSIVKNMLLHSRQGSAEHRPVDINALVEESLNLAYHGARAERQGFNITLERSFDPTAGEVDVFPQDITRVLLNLISNGFYAATKRRGANASEGYEPTLKVATKDLGDRVEIKIRDNGTGIPPEVKDRIFNPFFTTKPAGEGTGLGLSISHDIIVKQHAGSIEVDSQPGEFTEFRITLPRTAASLAKSGGEHEPVDPRGR